MNQDTTQFDPSGLSKQKTPRQVVKHLFGCLLAFLCLLWVFYDLNYSELLQNMLAINWRWIIPAVACDILGYVFQGQRWRMLLRHLGSITLWDATKAIYAGLFTNEILPLRIGEVLRTYLVARWLSIPFVVVIPSVVIERLFDGIWLGVAVGITAIVLEDFPEEMLQTADNVGIAVLLITFLFVSYIVFTRRKWNSIQSAGRISWKPLRTIVLLFRKIIDEIHTLGTSKSFYLSFLVSSLVLLFQILAFWFVMLGYGLNSSVLAGTAVLLFIRLGTLLPNAPSNVGTYQFLCVTGLMFFGVDKTTAAGFSVVVFIIITVPLWAVGLFAISRCGLATKEIKIGIKRIMRKTFSSHFDRRD